MLGFTSIRDWQCETQRSLSSLDKGGHGVRASMSHE